MECRSSVRQTVYFDCVTSFCCQLAAVETALKHPMQWLADSPSSSRFSVQYIRRRGSMMTVRFAKQVSFCNWITSLVVVCLLANFQFSGSFAEDAPTQESIELNRRIEQLIIQLGNDHYAARRQAQSELEQIGVAALDQLQVATLNPDPQIAAAARYMIRSSYVRWTGEGDPLVIRKLLEQYGTGDPTYRADRIDRLAKLPNDQGLSALLRIARFETSGNLSKRAAIAVIQAKNVEDEVTSNASRWRTVSDSAGLGKNSASRWLTEFSAFRLKDKEFDSDFWQNQAQEEMALWSSRSVESSREIVISFIRFVSEQLIALGKKDEALAQARKLLSIEFHAREQTTTALDLSLWALNASLPELVVEQCSSLPPTFQKNARLEYLLAESYRILNQESKMEESVELAFSRHGAAIGLDIALYNRIEHAEFLRQRKQYDWSEKEFRAALEASDPHQQYVVHIRYTLASMLADGQDYRSAAEVMRPMIEMFDAEPAFAREVNSEFNQMGVNDELSTASRTQTYRSYYLHFRAQALKKEGDVEKAKADLNLALEADRGNVDVIISMNKLDGNDEWKKATDGHLAAAVKKYRVTLPKLERAMNQAGPADFASYRRSYANTLNTYAWLLVCTKRDLETALQCSDLACKLEPDQDAYLDTLARCNFQSGFVAEAIRIQKRAVALEPSSRELARSLAEYQSAPSK